MKKLTTFILITAIILGTPTITWAIQPRNIKEQKKQVKVIEEQQLNSFETKYNLLTERYINNFRNCEPIHINDYIDIFGLKINLKFDVNGWIDNKCSYFLTGRIDGIGKDIREVFDVKIPDEKIAQFEPHIQCNFSKDELNILVDGVIANRKNNIVEVNNLLKSPVDKYSQNEHQKLSTEEEKMIKMLSNGKTCTIANLDELIQQFSALTQPQTEK